MSTKESKTPVEKALVAKTFKWDSAHRLFNYKNICKNLHGHSYKTKVVIKGPINDNGFVLDFNEMKPIQKWLDANWDHATIVSDKDKNLIDFLKKEKQRHFIMQDNPTAENMCREIYKIARKIIPGKLAIYQVSVWETETSEAIYLPHEEWNIPLPQKS